METVALGYYVADQTRLAVWSAVIAAAGFVPDRRDRAHRRRAWPTAGPRKAILLVTISAQAVVAAVVDRPGGRGLGRTGGHRTS